MYTVVLSCEMPNGSWLHLVEDYKDRWYLLQLEKETIPYGEVQDLIFANRWDTPAYSRREAYEEFDRLLDRHQKLCVFFEEARRRVS